ncbi:hypothetical protein WCE01_01590 [Acinetobacter indicus]|uniref:hypothetical protein n=1 Tax=Acinetobacter indicus TaxID=756892 RepID=UPI0034D788CF
MKANEFVREDGLYAFKHALAQLSFKPKMFLVVYQYECEFVNEIKPNHGNCVFSYDDVKRLVESHELVEKFDGLAEAKKIANNPLAIFNTMPLKQAIADVESCMEVNHG